MECQKILWNRFGIELKKLHVTVLNQSSLGNAMEICSAGENVNKHFHMQVFWAILTQHGQHTIKDRNSNILRS